MDCVEDEILLTTMKLTEILLAVAIAFGLIFIIPSACTRPEQATRILIQNGYSNIEITGWRPFAAGKDDTFATGFSAISPSGHQVTGAVTSGWFKGGTIRLD